MEPVTPRAVVFDLDGTLLGPRQQIDPVAAEWLAAAVPAGCLPIFATARPPRATLPLLGRWAAEYVICYNGGVTLRGAVEIASRLITAGEVRHVLEHVVAHHPEVSCGFECDDALYVRGDFDRHFPREFTCAADLRNAAFRASPKILIDLPEAGLALALRSKLPAGCAAVVTDGGTLMQVMATGVSKRAAVGDILLRHQISWSECVGFGDDLNDVELLQSCGRSVAMANAHPRVREIATDVTSSNADGGVGRFLERVFPIR